MPIHLHYEKNSMRKSHRITLPIKIHVNNIIHDALDWSLTGVSIKRVRSESFTIENLYDGVLVLSMKGAAISLQVKLKCIYLKDDKYGFEFVGFSQKNKKVLRRYLELYLDGKLEEVDDLMAVYEEPDINSAIQEPVKLNEYEKTGLEKSFLRKSIGAILFSLLLFSAIAALAYQNLRYKYERVGMVEANYKMVYPKNEGIIKNLYLKSGDKVQKNDVLADLNSEKILYQLKVLESIKNARIKEKQLQLTFQKQTNRVVDDNELLTLKKQIVQERFQDLQNANIQFQNHLITKADMRTIKKSYQDAKERYAFYKKQSAYQKNSNVAPLSKVINVEEIELKILHQKSLLEEFRIFSPHKGTVYEVNAEVGDRVSRNDPFLTLWTHDVPQIVVTLSAYKAVDLKIGTQVEIVDSLESHKFSGVVKRINDSSFDNDPKIATLKKANEVFVTIEPEENAKVLPPYSIVKVLFKRTFGF